MVTASAFREACRPERTALEGIAASCVPRHTGTLGFVEDLNNKVRVIPRSVFGYGDEEYFRLKILTAFLARK